MLLLLSSQWTLHSEVWSSMKARRSSQTVATSLLVYQFERWLRELKWFDCEACTERAGKVESLSAWMLKSRNKLVEH